MNSSRPKQSLVGGLVLLSLGAPSVSAEWGSSVVEQITYDHIRKQTDVQSLALDDLDNVHMVWKRVRAGPAPGWHILYSTNSSGDWRSPEEVSDPDRASFSPGLAISPIDGQPVVVFEEGSGMESEIVVARRRSRGWERESLTSNTLVDCCVTLAVDDAGQIHLAWITGDRQSGEYKIAYALGDRAGWDIQIVTESELGEGASPYIAVAPGGVAHIVYVGGTIGESCIHHAWSGVRGGSIWSHEVLTSGNIYDLSAALAIGYDGDLHLAVNGNDGWGLPGRVYYFHQPAGQSWESPELASLGYSAARPSIDLAIDGSPHVVWAETGGTQYTGDLFYSYKDADGNWAVSSVVGGDHFSPSLQVDGRGFGHLGCYTGGNTGDYDIYHVRSRGALTEVAQAVDIRPWSEHNFIYPFSRLLIPVAILGSDDFDVAEVDAATLAFGPSGASPLWGLLLSHWDVNDDGSDDGISYYRTEETGIAMGDTEACLTGETLDGTPFEGCDAITTVPGCGHGFEAALVVPPLVWIGGRVRRRRRAVV